MVDELLDRYLDEDGNPKPLPRKKTKTLRTDGGNISDHAPSDAIRCHLMTHLSNRFPLLIYLSPKSNLCQTSKRFYHEKRILLSVFSVLFTAGLFAQGQGLAGINEATSLMTSYFDPATKLCYAIGAVLGLVGGIKTYGKFSSGDPDTSKTAASWFFACIFLIVAATILRSFFPLIHGVPHQQRAPDARLSSRD